MREISGYIHANKILCFLSVTLYYNIVAFSEENNALEFVKQMESRRKIFHNFSIEGECLKLRVPSSLYDKLLDDFLKSDTLPEFISQKTIIKSFKYFSKVSSNEFLLETNVLSDPLFLKYTAEAKDSGSKLVRNNTNSIWYSNGSIQKVFDKINKNVIVTDYAKSVMPIRDLDIDLTHNDWRPMLVSDQNKTTVSKTNGFINVAIIDNDLMYTQTYRFTDKCAPVYAQLTQKDDGIVCDNQYVLHHNELFNANVVKRTWQAKRFSENWEITIFDNLKYKDYQGDFLELLPNEGDYVVENKVSNTVVLNSKLKKDNIVESKQNNGNTNYITTILVVLNTVIVFILLLIWYHNAKKAK